MSEIQWTQLPRPLPIVWQVNSREVLLSTMGLFTPQPKVLTGVRSKTLPTTPRIYCFNRLSVALPVYLLPQGFTSQGASYSCSSSSSVHLQKPVIFWEWWVLTECWKEPSIWVRKGGVWRKRNCTLMDGLKNQHSCRRGDTAQVSNATCL